MPEWLAYINVPWVYYALMVVYSVTIVSVVFVVLSENRNPVKSLAWVTVLMLLPALGLVLYFFFGRNIKNTRMVSRHNRRLLRKREEAGGKVKLDNLGLDERSQRLIRLTRSLSGSACYSGNDVRIYTCASDKFRDLFADLAAARVFIDLQYYIIEDDEVGRQLCDILIDRVRAGVKVRVIYDNVGSFDLTSRIFKRLRKNGVEAYPFFKVMFPPFGTRINWRNHRKICAIDGNIGYIGGMNMAKRYATGGKFATWRDTHLRITGPAVISLMNAFTIDWTFMGRELEVAPKPETSVYPTNYVMQLLTSGPTMHWDTMEHLFVKAIGGACRRVFVQTPYFLPTEGLLKALQSAALSGCDVRVMMPRRSDSVLLNYASASYVRECLRAGIKIYLYEAGMMHAKTLLVDDEFVSVGSTNFDFRSFEHNFEANMQIYSREINRKMIEIFNEDIRQCSRVVAADWDSRPVGKKILESVMRLMSPVL